MSRSELGELVRALKEQLEWQSGGFTSKICVEPASDLDRETFEATVRQRRERAVEKTKASFLDEEEPAPRAAASNAPRTPQVQQPVNTHVTPSPTSAAVKPQPASKDTSSRVQSLWKTTGSRPSTTFQSNTSESLPTPWEEGDNAAIKLEKVRALIGDCKRCGLCTDRNNIVFGVGNPSARLMFIGEAPGFNEDKEGEPFIGKAGELLDKMIVAMGLKRSDVFIANIIKCRPPNNRDPEPAEIQKCSPFLKLQIQAVAPEVIVALGKFSSNTLTNRNESLATIRGKWQSFENIPMMPTFHPAYLLRNGSGKREAWADLQEVMKKLDL